MEWLQHMVDLFKQETGLNVYNLRASHYPKQEQTITETVSPLLELNYLI